MNLLERDGPYSLGPYQILIFGKKYVYLRGTSILKEMGDFRIRKRREKHPDIPQKSNDLIVAASVGHLELVKYLVLIKAKNKLAICDASRNNYYQVVKYLASNGSDFTVFDHLPFRYACRNKNKEIMDYLESKIKFSQMDYEIIMNKACSDNDVESMKFCLSRGLDVKSSNCNYLDICYNTGWFESVKILLSHGAYDRDPSRARIYRYDVENDESRQSRMMPFSDAHIAMIIKLLISAPSMKKSTSISDQSTLTLFTGLLLKKKDIQVNSYDEGLMVLINRFNSKGPKLFYNFKPLPLEECYKQLLKPEISPRSKCDKVVKKLYTRGLLKKL